MLEEARRRLEQIETQAVEAEDRAARAERLAELRDQEVAKERQLHEMIGRINDAEQRAREAEQRARRMVADVARPRGRQAAAEPAPAEPPPEPETASAQEPVSLSSASFEQLRAAGLSVTQTGRVLAHRERTGGFSSLEELTTIPGFPRELLDSLRGRLVP